MDYDITKILQDWPFNQDQNIRIITGNDGRALLQVRQPLGIEQYEMTGRPDGAKPHGFEFFLDYLEAKLHGSDARDKENGFKISDADFLELQQEGILMYYRYIILYQIHEYSNVVRDTAHNLRLCSFIEAWFDSEQKNNVLQFKPFILRMNGSARALELSEKGRIDEAILALDEVIENLEGLSPIASPAFTFEKARSINYLNETREKILQKGKSPARDLEDKLKEALSNEDYEEAAKLRDRIRALHSMA